MKVLRLVIVLLILSGCTKVLTNKVPYSNLQKDAYRTVQEFVIYEPKHEYKGFNYFLTSEGNYPFGREPEGNLSKVLLGTRLNIVHLEVFYFGSSGPCWRVGAVILDGEHEGKKVELPACERFQLNSWFKPRKPYVQTAKGSLGISPEISVHESYLRLTN